MIKDLVKSFALRRGCWTERTIPDDRVADLIETLRPVRAGAALRRLGPAGDGGYLVPDDLDGIGALISPGVSQECGFDLQIADMGVPVRMLDGSVPGPPRPHPNFHFTPRFLDSFASDHTITLAEVCEDLAPGSDLLLQMDIEGAEYRVLHSAPEALLSRFRIMIIEFHWLDRLFTAFGFNEIAPVFGKLLRTHHVVHIHPNNGAPPKARGPIVVPPMMEFTFYRKDRGAATDRPTRFPHALDADNLPDWPPVVLPKCWIGEAA